MPCFRAHQLASPLPPLQEVSPLFAMCHVSELTNLLLPLPPLQQVSPLFATCHVSKLTNPFLPLPLLQEMSPCLQHATFPSSPTLWLIYLLSSLIAIVPATSMSQKHLADLFETALYPPPSETLPLGPSKGIHDYFHGRREHNR